MAVHRVAEPGPRGRTPCGTPSVDASCCQAGVVIRRRVTSAMPPSWKQRRRFRPGGTVRKARSVNHPPCPAGCHADSGIDPAGQGGNLHRSSGADRSTDESERSRPEPAARVLCQQTYAGRVPATAELRDSGRAANEQPHRRRPGRSSGRRPGRSSGRRPGRSSGGTAGDRGKQSGARRTALVRTNSPGADEQPSCRRTPAGPAGRPHARRIPQTGLTATGLANRRSPREQRMPEKRPGTEIRTGRPGARTTARGPGPADRKSGPADQEPGPADQEPGPADQEPGPADQEPGECRADGTGAVRWPGRGSARTSSVRRSTSGVE
jgi:hypothetical protein